MLLLNSLGIFGYEHFLYEKKQPNCRLCFVTFVCGNCALCLTSDTLKSMVKLSKGQFIV